MNKGSISSIFAVVIICLIYLTYSMPCYSQDYSTYLMKGRSAEAKGDLKNAELFYSSAVKLKPTNTEALYALARVLSWQKEDRARSILLFEQIYPAFKNNKEFLMDYGSALYWTGKHAKSRQILQPLLTKSPNDIKVLNLMSNILLAEGKLNDALNYSLKSVKFAPDNVEALKNIANIYFWSQNYPLAIKYYRQLAALNVKDKDIQLNHVYSLIYSRSYEEAESLLDSLNLDKSVYYKAKAKLKFYSGDAKAAADYYSIAQELNPDDTELSREYSEVLKSLSRGGELKQKFENDLSTNPNSIVALKELGDIYNQEGNFAKSIVINTRLIQLGEVNKDITTRLAYSYLYNKQYNDAINFAESYKNIIGDETYYNIMAKANFYSGNPENAEPYYQSAISLDPLNNELKSEYADVLLGIGQYNKAEEALQSLAGSVAKDDKTQFKLVNLALAAKDYQKAHNYLNQIIARNPQNAEAYYMKGETEFYQGRLEPALTFYRQAYGMPGGKNKKIIKRIAELSSYTKDVEQATEMYNYLSREYPEERINAGLGMAQAQQISGSLYKARREFERVLQTDPNNVAALLGIANIHNDLNQMLHAIKILEPLSQQNPDNDELKISLARSYSLLGRKDKAVQILGKQFLGEHKDNTYILREIYWNNRTNITATFRMSRESGDRNNKLKYENIGGVINYYPRGNLRLTSDLSATLYRSGDNVAKATSGNYLFGFEAQATDKLNVRGHMGFVNFSTEGEELNSGFGVRYRATDNIILRASYDRYKVEESFLSAVGLIPQTGPFRNLLVGQATDNLFRASTTILAPYYKFDFTGEYFIGFKQGEQLPTNMYQGFYTNTGFLLMARETYSPLNVLRFSNGTYFVSYDKNLSGFGGADLYYSPLGSDFGPIVPVPQRNIAGTGGYFSPGYAISSVFGLDARGYIKKLRLRYGAGMYVGLQNVKHNSTAFVYTPQLFLRFNEFGHVGADVFYLFNRYGSYNQHNFGANLVVRF